MDTKHGQYKKKKVLRKMNVLEIKCLRIIVVRRVEYEMTMREVCANKKSRKKWPFN